jgi:regulatory protein
MAASGDDRLAPVTVLSTWSSGGSSAVPDEIDGSAETPEPGSRRRSPAHPAGSALRDSTGSPAAPVLTVVPPATGLSESAGVPAAGSSEPVDPAPTPAERSRRERRPENVSMHALTRRGMSRWELEKLLEAREVDPEEIEAELARLESVGLVDDAALAETVVRTQHERKGLGRSALKAEMRRRHIDQEQIEAALDGLDDDSDLARARELALRRAPQLASLDPVTAARRLSGYIARKGYSSSVVRTVVDEALKGPRSGVRFDD